MTKTSHVQVGRADRNTADGAEAKAFADTYGEAVPEAGRTIFNKWVAAKVAYDANRTKDAPLAEGLDEAREAFLKAH